MRLRVECYSGYKAEQRPVRFYLGENRCEVEEVLDQWFSPDAIYFRVRADDGNFYVLRHQVDAIDGVWTLEAFRRARIAG